MKNRILPARDSNGRFVAATKPVAVAAPDFAIVAIGCEPVRSEALMVISREVMAPKRSEPSWLYRFAMKAFRFVWPELTSYRRA